MSERRDQERAPSRELPGGRRGVFPSPRRRRLPGLYALLAVAVLGCARSGPLTGDPAELTVSLERSSEVPLAIEVSGRAIGARTRLAVYTEAADVEDPTFPAVLGEVSHGFRSVRFVPRYPLEPGRRFQILIREAPRDPGGAPVAVSRLWVEVPSLKPKVATRVAAISPTSDELPANQLKLYIEFTAPMTTAAPYDHLRLVDEETGEPVEAVFHQMRGGLWDPGGQRLTVLFDPGRIKRGLANHEALGLPLVEGGRYRLEIAADWPDAAGNPLASGHSKRFVVGSPDRLRPSLAQWTLQRPAAGTLLPVVLEFDEPMDAALLPRSFAVLDAAGRPVATETRSGARQESCELWPESAWSPGRYRIAVDPLLEDLAGNNFERLFDHDLSAGAAAPRRTWLALEIEDPHLSKGDAP